MNMDEIKRMAYKIGVTEEEFGLGVSWSDLEDFANLVAAHERDAIMKSIEELRPVEDNPFLQNKPAAFWVENFRQIIYARSKA
jgi:hypothetical protein